MLRTLSVFTAFAGVAAGLANDTKITPPSWIETFGPSTRELVRTPLTTFSLANLLLFLLLGSELHGPGQFLPSALHALPRGPVGRI